MALADTVITAVAAGAAVVSAFFAYRSAAAGTRTVKLAEAARQDFEADRRAADSDRRDAELDRQAAERDRRLALLDRKRRRLEEVGHLVEAIFWGAHEASQNAGPASVWMGARNRLGQELVGLQDQLPTTADLLTAGDPGWAMGQASQAREEVRTALLNLGSAGESRE